MRYLVQKYKLPDHWYPSEPQRRAKIDEYLDWHHQNLRVGAAHTLFLKVYNIIILLTLLLIGVVDPMAATSSLN